LIVLSEAEISAEQFGGPEQTGLPRNPSAPKPHAFGRETEFGVRESRFSGGLRLLGLLLVRLPVGAQIPLRLSREPSRVDGFRVTLKLDETQFDNETDMSRKKTLNAKVQVTRSGKYVSLTYRISDDRGNVLEQTDLPVGYIYGGKNQLIGGMDDAVTGKQAGEQIDFLLSPETGFGLHDPNLTFTDRIENVPPEFRFVGAEVPMQSESGDVRTFYVTRVEGGELTVDGNHPFAGKTLVVHIEILDVRDATQEEWEKEGSSFAIEDGGRN